MQPFKPVAVLAVLVLNEVLYDPPGLDAGREFVEILNVSEEPVWLENVELQAGDGARPGTWRVVWRGRAVELRPGVPFVVGGDSVTARNASLEGALQNGPDALRLWRDGSNLDVLGYGALDDPQMFESRPAPDVSGASLARIPDGIDRDDNGLDWQRAVPSPGRRNLPQRDWALQLDEPDVTRLWPFRALRVRASVSNRGSAALESGSWNAVSSLRRILGEPYVDGWTWGESDTLFSDGASPRLAAGDSVIFDVRWLAQPGLFELAVEALGSDENANDNRARLLLRVGSGDVVVHEILFAPAPQQSEWIELHNRGSRPHDLGGWTLADATGKRVRLRATRALEPGAYAVVSGDTLDVVPGLATDALRVAASPWPSLNNTDAADGFADHVVLRDPSGIVQDAVFYRAAWGAARGRSIERLTLDPDARGLLWATSKDGSGATPGRANSATAWAAAEAGLRLQPNPFSPDSDGIDELLAVSFQVPEPWMGFEASIFDLEGRRRRWLAADQLGPGPRRILWEGEDDDGNPLVEGVYVLRLEFLGHDDPGSSQLRCIGLVRGARPRAGTRSH